MARPDTILDCVMKSRRNVRLRRNLVGNKRVVDVVAIQKPCWRMKAMVTTPKTAMVLMVRRSLQGHIVPPMVKPSTNDVYMPAFRNMPSQSSCLSRVLRSLLGWGRCDRITNRYIGDKTP
jgi:hypothetical protein